MFEQLYEPETAAPASAVTLATPVAPAAVVSTIKAAVLSQFKATEPVLQALVARYENVAIDVSTPKGLADAKAARHDLRENGRFVVQRARDAIKGDINALKPLLESEAERLIAIVQPVEDLYDAPIKAREAQLAVEKAEREAKEAARVAAHRANIAKLASYVGAAQGKTSAQILTVINGVAGIDIIPEQWEEFAGGADAQKADTLEALRGMFNRTKSAEDEAAAREAQRIENERVAAELAEQKRLMAEKQAELDRQLAEIAAAKKAEEDEAIARIWEAARRIEGPRAGYVLKAQGYFESGCGTHFADDPRPRIIEALSAARAEMAAQMRAAQEREDKEREEYAARIATDAEAAAIAAESEANARAAEASAALLAAQPVEPSDDLSDDPVPIEQLSDDAIAARPEIAAAVPAIEPPAAADMDDVAAKAWTMPAGPITFAEPPAPAADEPATLNLTAINDRFGGALSVTAAGLAMLGIHPAAQVKASKLYRESQFIALCDALVDHIGNACAAAA